MQYTVVATEAQRHDYPSCFPFITPCIPFIKVTVGEKSDAPNFPLTPNVVHQIYESTILN